MTDLATIVLTSVGLMGLLALMLYLLGLASSAADRRAAYERALAEGLDLAALRAKIDAEDEWPTATYHPISRAELLALLAAVETRPAAVEAIEVLEPNVLPTTEAARKAEAAWKEGLARLRSEPLEFGYGDGDGEMASKQTRPAVEEIDVLAPNPDGSKLVADMQRYLADNMRAFMQQTAGEPTTREVSNVLPTTEAGRKAEKWKELMAELRSRPLEVYRRAVLKDAAKETTWVYDDRWTGEGRPPRMITRTAWVRGRYGITDLSSLMADFDARFPPLVTLGHSLPGKLAPVVGRVHLFSIEGDRLVAQIALDPDAEMLEDTVVLVGSGEINDGRIVGVALVPPGQVPVDHDPAELAREAIARKRREG